MPYFQLLNLGHDASMLGTGRNESKYRYDDGLATTKRIAMPDGCEIVRRFADDGVALNHLASGRMPHEHDLLQRGKPRTICKPLRDRIEHREPADRSRPDRR